MKEKDTTLLKPGQVVDTANAKKNFPEDASKDRRTRQEKEPITVLAQYIGNDKIRLRSRVNRYINIELALNKHIMTTMQNIVIDVNWKSKLEAYCLRDGININTLDTSHIKPV